MPRKWLKTEEDYLRRHWGKRSASVIGKSLDRSRNSVIGKAQRLSLPMLVPANARHGNNPGNRPYLWELHI